MATRRTQRKRKVSDRVRVVDTATLAAAHARRLEALEDDADDEAAREADVNAIDDEYELSDGGGDDSDAPDVGDTNGARKRAWSKKGAKGGGSRAKKGRRSSTRTAVRAAGSRKSVGIEKWNKPLAIILDEEGPVGPATAPGGYFAIAALPDNTPPRQLCSICGYMGPYTCTRCMVRFCSIRCGTVHEETRCLKFTL